MVYHEAADFASDMTEIKMQKAILTPPKNLPSTFTSFWLEEIQRKVSLCIKTKLYSIRGHCWPSFMTS